jgi:hypothetical protein
MTELEDQIRDDLEFLASSAPSTTPMRVRIAAAATPARPPKRGRVTPLLVVAGIVAAGAVATHALQGQAPEKPTVATSTGNPSQGAIPDEAARRSVNDFVRGIRSTYGPKVYVATDWEAGKVLIGVAPPIPVDLTSLDGTTVADLRVAVFPASVTVGAFEAFVKAVGAADFPGKDRVCSFGMPQDSAAIQVNVRALSDLTPSAVSELQAHLQKFTTAAIRLTEARQGHPLGGATDPAESTLC